MKRAFLILLALTASTAARVSAALTEEGETVPTVSAGDVRADIVLDGILDPAEWGHVPGATGFVQQLPVEGAPAVERTEVHVVFDERYVYVGARMFDDNPSSIAKQVVRRDERGQYDDIIVGFDTNLDLRTGYLFLVSASNVQWDAYLFDDGEIDDTWDAVWASAVHIDEFGWSAEMRIPLSQMRYEASDGPQTWGVNYVRHKKSTNEETHFALISQLQGGRVSQFGRLEGVVVRRAARRLEFRPYVLASTYQGPGEPGNPFATGSEYDGRVGLDVRYGIGSQFTLDATVNPDFGQVEADPAVINLSAFETFFEERRPFFVEDARIFDFRLSGRSYLFYSRRIGRSPHGNGPGSSDFIDIPDAATILGAAKLTGKTSGGLSVGALGALTRQERGRGYAVQTGQRNSFVVEPLTGYGVVRAVQDFNDGASAIGGMVTLLRRDLPADGAFDFLPSVSTNFGIDWEHQWNDREWAFTGYVAGSHVRGDSSAITRIQRSPNHYLQRPDAPWLTLDSTRTSISGIDWRMTLARQRGRHWTGSIWAAQVTPGFEVNDIGYSRRQEVLDGGARVTYREIEPGERLRSYEMSFSTFHNWTHDALKKEVSWNDAHVSGSFNLRGDVELLNYWSMEASASYRPELVDRSATRGGPMVLNPRSYQSRLELRSDPRSTVSFGSSLNYEWGEQASGNEVGMSVGLKYRPSARVEIELEPEWSRSRTGHQYVGVSDVLSYDPTFGRRYLFGELEREEVSLETRVSVAFNPRLSLQLFLQPLLSAGDYTAYKQLVGPRTYDFDVFEQGTFAAGACATGRTCVDDDGVRYVDFDGDGAADHTFGDRNFNVRSLIGNAVLRWEYRPGSTLFLVWQRQQSDRTGLGNFDFRRDADALLRADAENVLMIKLNYWFGV